MPPFPSLTSISSAVVVELFSVMLLADAKSNTDILSAKRTDGASSSERLHSKLVSLTGSTEKFCSKLVFRSDIRPDVLDSQNMSRLDTVGAVSYTFSLVSRLVTSGAVEKVKLPPPTAPISLTVDTLPIYGFAPFRSAPSPAVSPIPWVGIL